MPGEKESLAFSHTGISERCTRATGIGHALEVSHEVGPAELAPLKRVAVIGTPPDGDDDSGWIPAKERLPIASGTASDDPKAGGTGYDRNPHPASMVTQLSAGLIDCKRGTHPYSAPYIAKGIQSCRRGLIAHGLDGTDGGRGYIEQIGDELSNQAPTQAKASSKRS